MPLRAKQGQTDILAFQYSEEAWQVLKANHKSLNLIMPCCNSSAIPKTSPRGTQFFAHAKKHDCNSVSESQEHLFIKSLVARSAAELGWDVKTEWRGSTPSGEGWVADVFCVRRKSKIAFEIQMSWQTIQETQKRQARYQESGIRSAWFASAKTFDNNYIRPTKDIPFFLISASSIPNEPHVESFGLPLSYFVKQLLQGKVTWQLTPWCYSIHFMEDVCWKCKKAVKQVYGYSIDIYELNAQTVPHFSKVLFKIEGIISKE